jgi:hypothetical protein
MWRRHRKSVTVSTRILAVVLTLLPVMVNAFAQPVAVDDLRERIVSEVNAARSAGSISAENHECVYHNIACGLVLDDHVNIFGCSTPSGGYYNVHRMTVSAGKRIQLGMRSPDFRTLIILTDANSSLIAYRFGVDGEFSNDLFHTTTYTGTYYILAGPAEDFTTGRYVIYVACQTAPPPPPPPPPCDTPTISAPSVTIAAGTRAVLIATATGGTPPFRFKWYDENDPAIPLAEGSTFTTAPLFTTAHYSLTVTNACGRQAAASVTANVMPLRRRAVRK